MKNVLVTGGAGFIGSHLIDGLVKKYPESSILSVDNYSTGKKENENKKATYMQIPTHRISKDSKSKIDFIFHFGEYSRIASSFDDSDIVSRSNIIGTSRVLELWKESRSVLVYSGSSSIFSDASNPYTYSKAHNVELIKNYSKWFGLPYVITYFYNVYGPRQIKNGKMSTVIGIFLDKYTNSQPLPIVGSGLQQRDFTHIEDIISGILAAIEYGKSNQEYHLCSGQPYSINEVAEMFPQATLEYLPERKGERFDSTGSPEKAMEILDWKPERNLREWIKYTLENKNTYDNK